MLKSKLAFTSTTGREFNKGDKVTRGSLIQDGVTDDEIKSYFDEVTKEEQGQSEEETDDEIKIFNVKKGFKTVKGVQYKKGQEILLDEYALLTPEEQAHFETEAK